MLGGMAAAVQRHGMKAGAHPYMPRAVNPDFAAAACRGGRLGISGGPSSDRLEGEDSEYGLLATSGISPDTCNAVFHFVKHDGRIAINNCKMNGCDG
jgi:hypothetical protein